jgi:glucosamine--fructose-6-phosphate aminotransferase (isomerizing)
MNPPMVENILAQASSLNAVMAYHYGDGRAALINAKNLLRSAQRIILSGMGASLNACIPLANFLATRGIMVSVIETSELLYFQAELLNPETSLVLVSRSGESVEVTKLLPIARQRGCKVVGLVNVPASTLAREATCPILLNSPADQLVAIQTYTGSVVALMLLGAAFTEEMDGQIRADLEKTINVLSRYVPEWYRFSGGWPGFFANNVPIYLMGRGPSLASVHSGGLLLHEVAKITAVPMSSPQFRHGPVEVIHDQFRAVVFGTQKATVDLDRALAEKIVTLGGHARWVGPKPAPREVDSLCDWPDDVPELFMPVVDVIPMQLAAYHTARWLGLTPGEFRFATPITLSERDFAPASSKTAVNS